MMQNQDTQNKLNLLANAAHSAHLLDKSAFESLISETSVDVVWDILKAFQVTLHESISKLENTTISPEELYKVCHKLKGSSLLIGFAPLGDHCKTAMHDLKNNPKFDYEKSIEKVLICARETQLIVKALTK